MYSNVILYEPAPFVHVIWNLFSCLSLPLHSRVFIATHQSCSESGLTREVDLEIPHISYNIPRVNGVPVNTHGSWYTITHKDCLTY